MNKKPIFYVPVTREQFNGLPRAIRQNGMRSMAEIMVLRQALDALSIALAGHKHKWTELERRLYEIAVTPSL